VGHAVSDARERLRAAAARSAEAEERLVAVRETRDRARAFAGEVAHEVEGLVGVSLDISAASAEAIKLALRQGAVPTFTEIPAIERNAAARADAESKLSAAKMVMDEVDGDLRDAEASLTGVRDEAAAAIVAVMVEEATAIAERILALEGEAVLLRARLGGQFSPVGQLRQLPAAVVDVIAGSDRFDALMIRDPKLSSAAQRAGAVWTAFREALSGDVDAELSFDEPSVDDARAA
jgi:hypothetical protein